MALLCNFKGLVDRTADAGFQMKEVSADKGYLGASNMLATLQLIAMSAQPLKAVETDFAVDVSGSCGVGRSRHRSTKHSVRCYVITCAL